MQLTSTRKRKTMKSYQSIISKLLFISIFIKHVDLHYFRLTNTNLKSYITNASKRFNNPVNIVSFFSFCIKKPSRGVITSSRGFQKQTLTRTNSKQNNTRHDNATMKRTKRKRTQICSITKTEKSYNLRIDVVIGNMIKL